MFGKRNAPMLPVFSSGSIRLLSTISSGNHCVAPIHSIIKPCYGPNFVSHFVNIKQHIQFMRLIKGELELDDAVAAKCLTGAAEKCGDADALFEPADMIADKLATIRAALATCAQFIFEVRTLDVYEKDGAQMHGELLSEEEAAATKRQQTGGELAEDMRTLRAMLPADALCLIVGPVQPHLYNKSGEQQLEHEIIYSTLAQIEDVCVVDPTNIVCKGGAEKMLAADGEFTIMGRALFFIHLYETHFSERANAAERERLAAVAAVTK
jgi:hypothetical protein